MRLYGFIPAGLLSAGCAALLLCGVAAGQTRSNSSSSNANQPAAKERTASAYPTTHKGKKSRKTANNRRRRGQEKIDPLRAREIQEALIRQHYLQGTASGTWDGNSQAAMERYQADNGWQSKQVPDSRALIKLGLGPDHEHLLNPESAMTSQPASLRSARPTNDPPADVPARPAQPKN